MKVPGRHRVWIVSAAGVAAAALLALVAPLHDWLDTLEDTLGQLGLVSGLLAFGAITIAGSLAMLPAWVFQIAAGAAFGFGWGLVAALAATLAASLCAFLIGRYALRDRVGRAARRDPSFAAVDKAVKRDPFKVVALLRMSPVLPSTLKSYFLGVTCVDAIPYTAASALGMLPGIAVKVYVGYAGRDALASGGPLKWALLGAGLLATLAMAFFIGRAARKRLRLDEGGR